MRWRGGPPRFWRSTTPLRGPLTLKMARALYGARATYATVPRQPLRGQRMRSGRRPRNGSRAWLRTESSRLPGSMPLPARRSSASAWSIWSPVGFRVAGMVGIMSSAPSITSARQRNPGLDPGRCARTPRQTPRDGHPQQDAGHHFVCLNPRSAPCFTSRRLHSSTASPSQPPSA
jgi:hypothetical protein